MEKFKEYETGESTSVMINLGNYLPGNHLCKEVEAIVSSLDTSELEKDYSRLGQKALHPKLMLSVIFYGYIVGIRSGRKLAAACMENLAFIYLSKGYRPKKSALNDFRKDNYQHFKNLFSQVLNKCMEQDNLVDTKISIVDGSKLKANSSKRRTKNHAQYKKWEARLLEDIASLEQACLARGNKGIKKN